MSKIIFERDEKMIEILVLIIVIFLLINFSSFKKRRYSFEREFAKCESPIEESLMKKMHEAGLKPYSQIPCGKYRIDIALYNRRRKIAIECDGEEFHSSVQQKAHDEQKNKFLEKNKWRVLRFTGKEIYREVDWCVKVIQSKI